MSDDRIIDFNELKNKVKDSDVDKFEKELEYKYERWEYLNNLAEEIAAQK